MKASSWVEMSLVFPLSRSLVDYRRKVDLSPMLVVDAAETWAASSEFIGVLEMHQDIIVFHIQTSKPFEAWLNVISAETIGSLR